MLESSSVLDKSDINVALGNLALASTRDPKIQVIKIH